jgi:hypothetical protein
MGRYRTFAGLCFLLFLVLGLSTPSMAEVPIRVSIKCILDANNNRPVTGHLNTDAEINTELDWGNSILGSNMTEFQIDVIEFIDLPGVSQYFTSDSTVADRDALRTAAMADPTTFHWRTDAINIYINGGTGSAISRFPPDNDIILMNQWCGNNPSCILHEMGHTMNLMHTHETCCTSNQDGCDDTIQDNQSWTKDQIAQNNFGTTYNNLNASQKWQVDLVYNNIMSYHTAEPQLIISPCQMDRVSAQGYVDRTTHLTKVPVYVNSGFAGLFPSGSFNNPYKTLQDALDEGGLNNRVLVFQEGAYTMTQEFIDGNVEMVTRSGTSFIDKDAVQLWKLPVDLANSKTPAVAKAVKGVQDKDTAARHIRRDAGLRADKAATETEKANIRSEADARAAVNEADAIKMLVGAEGIASGDERLAIQFELAERYSQSGNCDMAEKYFGLVAKETDQPPLRDEALRRAKGCGSVTNGTRSGMQSR